MVHDSAEGDPLRPHSELWLAFSASLAGDFSFRDYLSCKLNFVKPGPRSARVVCCANHPHPTLLGDAPCPGGHLVVQIRRRLAPRRSESVRRHRLCPACSAVRLGDGRFFLEKRSCFVAGRAFFLEQLPYATLLTQLTLTNRPCFATSRPWCLFHMNLPFSKPGLLAWSLLSTLEIHRREGRPVPSVTVVR